MARFKQTFDTHIAYLAIAFVLIVALTTGVALLGLDRVGTLNEKAELLRQFSACAMRSGNGLFA